MTEKEEQRISHVYVRDPEHCWVPALQLVVDGDKAKITRPIFKNEQEMMQSSRSVNQRYLDNEMVDLNEYPNKVLPMQNVDSNGALEDYKDMVELPFMHEAAILYNLKKRHINERPYTRTGDIVIAVNPYQWFHELYSEKKRNYYSNRLVWEPSETDPRGVMEPHVYEVSALSYKGLAYNGEDQSILVSGESGAGKTETVKICLNHIATTQRGHVPEGWFEDAEYDPVVQLVVQSNPLLEAFGNAQTRKNDNSSRFGKYLQLQFDKNAKAEYGMKSVRCGLVGSRCEVYLLEKNRVVSHDSEERTFHIFYQLLAAPDEEKSKFWSKLKGATQDDFKYVGRTRLNEIEGKTDAEHFEQTIKALEMVKVVDDKLDGLFKAICIVLQLGNIGFQAKDGDTDKAKVTNKNDLGDLADLMQVSVEDLDSALTERTFVTRKETHQVPLNPSQAKEAADALAKETYQKVFLWLVQAINEATIAPETDDPDHRYGIIGLLDIFGFEVFEQNRFAQLCINYANEKLQQKFTEDIFSNVQAEYEAEGIPLEEIWYDDNTDVLDLIEGRTGLLNLLNEECLRPMGNDQDFVQKALQINKKSPCLIVHRTDRLSFAIQHFAGPVMYDAENFVYSNQDTLPTDLQELAEKCSNFIIKQPRSECQFTGRGRRESNIAAPTVWTKYKNQLNDLMKDLRATRSRYIRCIKPNNKKEPHTLDHKEVVEQLRCAGVVAGITISRSVFPNRLENVVVLARYSNMWDHKNYPSKKTSDMTIDEQRACDCQALMSGVLKPKEVYENGRVIRAFVVGKTKTYFRAGALEWLESNRMKGLDAQAVTIQKYARGWLARNAGNGKRRRQRFEEDQARLREDMEKERKAQLAREYAERQAERQKEYEELNNKITQLERSLRDSDRESEAACKAARERAIEARREIAELEDQLLEAEQKLVKEPKALNAQQDKKLDEHKKLIVFLKKENKKLKTEELKTKEKLDALRLANNSLMSQNEDYSETFEAVQGEAAKEDEQHDNYIDTVEKAKSQNRVMKEQVLQKQDEYMRTAEQRLEIQKTLARILTLIQESSKDRQLIEDTVVLALECEADGKAIMAALEQETS